MDFKRVTRKQTKIARQRATKLINDVREELSKKYKFNHSLVGSVAFNTAIEDSNGKYDLDYQLVLTKNSNSSLDDPTQIKNYFFNAFQNQKNEFEKIENSTTAITLINSEKSKKFSIDFVIIKTFPNKDEIIRRNNKDESRTRNEFTWNQLREANDAFDKFRKLPTHEKIDVIENHILPEKYRIKNEIKNEKDKKSSTQIFIEKVNNYVSNKRNNRYL